MNNTPENLKLISPRIQKDIINVAAIKTTIVIASNIGDELFSILVEEAHDILVKKQLLLLCILWIGKGL